MDAKTPYEVVLEKHQEYLRSLLVQVKAHRGRAESDLVELRTTLGHANERVREIEAELAAINLDLEREASNNL